jgi:purine nucleosidase
MSKLVLMDHDGGIDDLLSQLLLMTMEAVEVLAITVTPADCFIEPALESGYKLLQFLDKAHIPLGRGNITASTLSPISGGQGPKW